MLEFFYFNTSIDICMYTLISYRYLLNLVKPFVGFFYVVFYVCQRFVSKIILVCNIFLVKDECHWSFVMATYVLIYILFQFQNIVTVGQETIITPIFCQVDSHHCHLMTEQLGRFAIVGESLPGQKAVKSIALAAFAPAFHSSTDYTIRVYCIEDTKAAIQVNL